jgi:hypothetical protein
MLRITLFLEPMCLRLQVRHLSSGRYLCVHPEAQPAPVGVSGASEGEEWFPTFLADDEGDNAWGHTDEGVRQQQLKA